jgi:signal transduction histidine kinase
VSFRVLPHFYQTPGFYAICALFIGFTVITAYRWRIRIVTIRAEGAAFERARVARELHDTLLQDLSGASLMLQSISQRIPDDRLRMQFGVVLDRVQHGLGETRRALWDMREADSRDWITRL